MLESPRRRRRRTLLIASTSLFPAASIIRSLKYCRILSSVRGDHGRSDRFHESDSLCSRFRQVCITLQRRQ
jgi:hypothetical protein